MTAQYYPRSSGILLHITSLPSKFGIGDLGPAAYDFADTLSRAGQSWWQLLPLGPPACGGCPYQCYSAMAGNPDLISPELLRRDGLLTRTDLAEAELPGGQINFEKVAKVKRTLLARAFSRFDRQQLSQLRAPFESFRKDEAFWLNDFSLFMALKEAQAGVNWSDWPRDLARRKPSALRDARRSLAAFIKFHEFVQFLFFRQFEAFRKYSADRGVKLIGDLPIFVSGESADVWSNPTLFQLDRDRRPKSVAGVPPDYFSTTGQRWGNPLYNWHAMRKDGFRWWIERARMALRQADLVRIDHFRGMAACWSIRASEPTAERGRWVKSPGIELFDALQTALGSLPFIAEDLGVITADVEALRDRFHLPGMRVLQFAFGGDAENIFLPHHYIPNCIVYTGTHDNDTSVGWYNSLDGKTRHHLRSYVGENMKDPSIALIRLAWSSIAGIAITTLQDLLSLDSKARMNTPGTSTGNWGWRFDEKTLSPKRIDWLRQLSQTYGRNART